MWLLNNPQTLESEPLQKVKISLAEYESLDREGRMRILLQELARATIGKQGIDRFEQMLANINLSGPVPQQYKTVIFEMQQVRNTLVHRASRADQRLVKNCPWLKLKVRDRVNITRRQYVRYQKAVCEYAVLLAQRLTSHFGLEPSAEIDKLRSSLPF